MEASIANLERQLENAYELQSTASRTFRMNLASAIRARSLDPSTLSADRDRVAASLRALTETHGQVFRTLHDILSDEQRRSVAQAVHYSMGRSEERARELRGRLQGATPVPDRAASTSRKLQQLKDQLGLDSDQERGIRPILERLDEAKSEAEILQREAAAKRQMRDLLAAFEGPRFDPTEVDLSPIGDDPVHALDIEAQLITRMLPHLQSVQLERLASAIAPAHSATSL